MKKWAKYLGVAVGASVLQALVTQLGSDHIDWQSLISVALIAAGAYASKPPKE